MNNNLQHNADNRLLEDNKQVQQKVNKYAKKGRLRRIIAVLSAFVLLFTLNQLTFEADTLQRKETCGLEEHRHKRACKDDDGEIVCGQEEHAHTDACYQQRPVDPEPTVFDEFAEIDSQVVLASPMGEEDASISSETVDEAVSETTVELEDDTAASVEGDASENGLEAEYDLDQLYEEDDSEAAVQTEDNEDSGLSEEDAGVSAEGEREYAVDGETLVFLSDVLKGTGIAASGITAVSEIQDDSFVEDHLVIELVEGVKDEFVLKTVKSYDRIRLGIVTDDAIEAVWLTGGVAVEAAEDARIDGEADEPVEEPSADEAGDEVAADVTEDEQPSEGNTTVTDQILNSNENVIDETELKQTEVGNEETEVGDQAEAAEGEAAAVEDAQAEDAPDAEDGQVEDAPDTEDGQADDISGAEDGQADGEAARQDDISRRVRLDFTGYIATETHTVYLFDEAMNAVLVSAAEIAEADGVAVAVEAAEEEEADGEAASDEDGEAASDEDAEGGEAPAEAPAAEVVGETIPVLIITGDGEYTLNGTVYTVAGLVLPGDAAADIEEEPSDETAPDADETAEEAVAARVESVPVGYRLAYDLAEAEDYPLSLRALMDMAEPVYEAQEAVADDEASGADDEGEEEAAEPIADDEEVAEGEEEAVEAAADAEEEAAEDKGIEYDETLLAVETTGEDWLITPVADFDATIVRIDNITITLLNGRVEETYPAQTFDGATDYLTVHVEAPEGAFPEGTTMHLEDVVDEATLDKLGEPVKEGFTEVQRVHAVDITFRNRAGDEIEPLLPISVAMGVRETAEDEQTTVVHMDSEGNAEVVEAASVTDAAAAPLTEDAAQAEEEQGEQEETAAEATVSFTADAFSIYAVVVSKTLETKYLVSPGESYKITLTYTEDAQIPDGATLDVRELAGEEAQEYLEKTEASLAGNRMVTSAHFFDIKIMDGEKEVQPAAAVEVKIERIDDAAGAADAEGEAEAGDDAAGEAEQQAVEEAGAQAEGEAAENPDQQDDHVIMEGDPVVGAVHFSDEDSDPEAVSATETEEAVVFAASSFSVYGVVYTVDFYYGNYEWHIPGEGYITLSDLFKALHIDADAAQAAEVVFTDPALVAVRRITEDAPLSQIMTELGRTGEVVEANGIIPAIDWLLVSLQPFTSEEKLTVTMEDGAFYEIRVEDEQDTQIHFRVNDRSRGYFESYNDTGDRVRNPEYSGEGRLVKLDYDTNLIGQHKVFATSGNRYGTTVRTDWVKAAMVGRGGTPTWENTKNDCSGGQVYVSYYAPSNAKVIVLKESDVKSMSYSRGSENYRYPDGDTSLPKYLYTTDGGTLTVSNSYPSFLKGWYLDDACISTNNTLDISTISNDGVLTPVFESAYHYSFKANEQWKGYFNIPQWSGWKDHNNGYDNYWFTGDNGQWKPEGKNLPSGIVDNEGVTSFEFPVWASPTTGANYEFAYWLRDDGEIPVTEGDNSQYLSGFKDSEGNLRDRYNVLDRDTTYVAFFKPQGDYLVRVNWAKEGGATAQQSVANGHGLRSVHDDYQNKDIFWFYYANEDRPVIKATPYEGWVFDGWYNNGTELVSRSAVFDVYNYVYGNEQYNHRDLNLTPVFKRIDNYFHIWYDGTDGLGYGEPGKGDNTFYARRDGSGNIQGATSKYATVAKQNYDPSDPNNVAHADITLPGKGDVDAPQSVGDNKFELKGWYDVYTGQYYAPGATARIYQDSVFYADWFPSTYNIGQDTSDVFATTDTNGFITTCVFDYNNLFNMESIYLNKGESEIPIPTNVKSIPWSEYNKEHWYMNGSSDDFVFMSTVSGKGRSLNPYGRDYKNSNRETSTDGGYYTATVTQGLLSDTLKNRLFSESDALGKRFVGTANYLYKYDENSGYYYYDSDRNAASYNKNMSRFYVYNYTNQTNKSTADHTDFLPFNYGQDSFSEPFGEPNYWFGMSSRINFFLPNAAGFKDDNDQTGNRSVKGDEMVYKFAGDDDVWVFVDDVLVLDMGGIHGKVYGEINFSQGTCTIVSDGATKTNGDYDIMSYGSGGHVETKPLNLAEGDHTLTLYYLERGASQSNCAIYFNIAPRYRLRIQKNDKNNHSPLKGARFGIYTDRACTNAADLNYWNAPTNEFTTGDDGMVHAQGFAAGRTYYIKELAAPNGYPDMSGYVIKLQLDSRGNATVTVPAGATDMVDTSSMTPVDGQTGVYRLSRVSGSTDTIYLPILNDQETSITSTKTWSLLDGKEYRTFEMDGKLITEYDNSQASSTVMIQRYREDDNGTTVGDHLVRLVTQYFDSNGSPSNRDDVSLAHYDTKTQSVSDRGSLSFSLKLGDNAGICSVVATDGNLATNVTAWTDNKPFMVNGSSENRPRTASYTVSNIQNDAVVYITLIGTGAKKEANLPKDISSSGGEPRKISKDDEWNVSPTNKNGEALANGGVVALDKTNGWTHTWDNLSTVDSQIRRVYYYVEEVSGTTPQGDAVAAMTGSQGFIITKSSDGLSGGIITVNNILKAVKVKLRKRDKEKYQPDGKDVPLEGGEFYLYTEAEYKKLVKGETAAAVTPNSALIKTDEMGTYDGTKLLSDEFGRFYTGFLPMGTYYIVEHKAPDGYLPLNKHYKVIIAEQGMGYMDIPVNDQGKPSAYNGNTDEALQSFLNSITPSPFRKPGSDGIYNLYIDNTMDKGSIQLRKIWGPNDADNGAKSVLLKLGVIVNGAVSASDETVADVLSHPANYGLMTTQVVDVDGTKYIKIEKTGNTWPVLAIDNLPLKRHVAITRRKADGSGDETVYRAVDAWYYIEEFGYYDSNNDLHKVADRADDWTVSYGSTYTGEGHSITVGGQAYEVIKARKTNPDTLTVTNSFVTGLTVTKTWENFTIPEGYKVRVTYVLHRGNETTSTTMVVVYQRGTDGTPVANPASWTNLAKYSPTGDVYQYWATEQKAELIPANPVNDDIASTEPAVVNIKDCFTVTGDEEGASRPGTGENAGKFVQGITNTLSKEEKTANKLWRTSATSAETPLAPLDGTEIVLRLKQYKKDATEPEGTYNVRLNGKKDVDNNVTPGDHEETLSNSGNTANAREEDEWIAKWTDLPKYYWVPGTAHYEAYTYTVEEVSVKWGTDGSARNVVGDMTEDGQFLVTYNGTQITNTLNRKPVSFGKKWVNPSQQGQRWVQNGSNNVPIYVTLTRTRPPATGETLEEGATQVVQTLLSRQEMVYDTTNRVTIAGEDYTVTWADNSSDNNLIEHGYVYKFTIKDLEKYAYVNHEAKLWTYTLTEDRVGSVPGRLFKTSYEILGKDHADEGEYIVNIEENTFELPSTGGHGTGMFYILGSILTILAAVLLITKKRSDAAGID